MKNLIILFIISFGIAQAQDSEPSPWEFIWGYSPTPRVFEPDSFQQSSVFTGFQWGGSKTMNNALLNNVTHGGNYIAPDGDLIYPHNIVIQPTWLDATNHVPGYFGAVMMQYEPTLPLDGTNEGTILRPDDPADPIFGFRNRKGTISNNPSVSNYSRLVLYKTASYVGDTVLSDIWPQPEFTSIMSSYQTNQYYGKIWYLTINLRRLKPSLQTIKDDSVVISIKIPYTRWDNLTGNIRFDSIPSNIPNDTTQLNYFEDRGIAQNMVKINPAIDSISITRKMLPITSDEYENITISAEFKTNGDSKFNKIFSRDSANAIKSFDIEVNYFGHTDVAIDWVRVENARAHHLLRGEFDSLGLNNDTSEPYANREGYINLVEDPDDTTSLSRVSTIKDIVQSVLDTIRVTTNNYELGHLSNFYFQDTENDSYYWWGALRYCNKFTNGLYMTRDGIRNSKLYYYYTKSPHKWIGVSFDDDDALMPAPYSRSGAQTWKTMGLKSGFYKSLQKIKYTDTLSSGYEIKLRGLDGYAGNWSDLKDDIFYNNHIQHSDVLQARYEKNITDSYFSPQKNGFLFSEKPWWLYVLLFNLALENNTHILHHHYRVKTAEEFRLMCMSALIKGCKGFIFDGDENNHYPNISASNPGIGDNTKLNANNDIYSDSVGTDFIDAKYNTWNAYPYADLPTLADSMEIDTSRMYIGTKSYRAELFEMNSFIRANDALLMNLRLSATYSKGYRAYYSQDDALYGTDTLLTKFIDIDTTRSYTTRLFPKSPWDINFLHEPFDSAFFDLTILRDKDVSLDSIFYIGVQNRRVDPLFHYIDPITNDSIMRFLSSAEFRDSCRNSPDSLLYQSYWWKRLGARKITIPFDYTYSDTNDYKLLRISEIGSDVDSLNQQWHRGPKYYDMVTDTVIGQDRSLSFDLLPGQGKILKVEVLKPGIVEGFLDNYNQTNLVGYPDAIDSNKNVYHLVLYKYSTKPDDPSKTYKEVHYIQSMPIDKNSNLENIVWNNATRMNISRRFLESLSSTDTNYVDCNHPALVVRKDSLGHPFAYVVYTCKDSSATNNDSALVVEAKIDAMTGVIQSNNQIFKLSFNDIDRFGTPTINASAKGNFLAWTDSVRGMIIGYQRPSEDVPSVIDSITPYQFDAFTPGALLYPSFNTYSDIKHGENNAGLVWYQAQKYGDGSGVFYSRIFFNELTNKIEKVIPPQFSGYYGFTTGLNLKTIRLAKTIKETKPIIYRDLKDYNDSNLAWCLYNRFDQINWIDSFYVYVPPPWTFHFSFNFINSLTLMHRDTNGYPEKWASTTINKYLFGGIFSDIQINSINSAQADGIVLDTTEVQVGGNYNLDFTIDGQEIYQLPGYTRSLNMSSMFGASMINYSENKARKAAHGSNVQLAKTMKPNFNANGQMWKNRRVYETSSTDSLDNPYILSSGKLFYKTYANEIVNHGYYGFTGDSNNVYFDLPKLEGDFGDISSRSVGFVPITPLDPCGDIFQATTNRDTILTNALNFPDYDNDGDREMQISMYGYKNSKVKVYLQRELDSSLTLLTMPTTSQYPYNATKLIYSILDSANSDFRLMYVNDDTTAHFNEKSFIYGMENADTISYKSAIEKDPVKYIIDFNNGGSQYVANHTNAIELKVYPNPTTGLVKVQAILPEEIDNYKLKNRDVSISIYNATGKMIVSKNGVSGQTFNFDLQNNPTGAYIINAEYNDDTHPLKATENLVKQ